MVLELAWSMKTSNTSPSSALMPSMSSSTFPPKTFISPVWFKLGEENYLWWKHQALACIKSNKLKDHLNKRKIPVKYASKGDRVAEIKSQKYLNQEQQDQYLVAWLLALMDSGSTRHCMAWSRPLELGSPSSAPHWLNLAFIIQGLMLPFSPSLQPPPPFIFWYMLMIFWLLALILWRF